MKKAISAITLAIVMMLGATFTPASTGCDSTGGIIVFGAKDGIIVFGNSSTGIIVFGKDGIIVFGSDGAPCNAGIIVGD